MSNCAKTNICAQVALQTPVPKISSIGWRSNLERAKRKRYSARTTSSKLTKRSKKGKQEGRETPTATDTLEAKDANACEAPTITSGTSPATSRGLIDSACGILSVYLGEHVEHKKLPAGPVLTALADKIYKCNREEPQAALVHRWKHLMTRHSSGDPHAFFQSSDGDCLVDVYLGTNCGIYWALQSSLGHSGKEACIRCRTRPAEARCSNVKNLDALLTPLARDGYSMTDRKREPCNCEGGEGGEGGEVDQACINVVAMSM